MSSSNTHHPSRFLQELQRRVIIYDGAMGVNIQSYQLGPADYGGERTEGCNEFLVLTRPDVIEEIHTGFMEAGCDVLETDTFTGSRLKLDEYGLGERTREINIAAAQLARRIADRYSTPEKPRFVAGSIGPTGMLPSSDDPALSKITYQQLAEIFREQAAALSKAASTCCSSKPARIFSKCAPPSPGSAAPSTIWAARCPSRRRSRWTPAGACCWAPILPPP